MKLIKSIKQVILNAKTNLIHLRQIYRYNRSPLRKKQPVLAYQMGKVGSSTIRRSLNALNRDIYIYHLHYMSGIDNMIGQCKRQYLPLQDHILASIYCKRMVEKTLNGRKIDVITLVRDPIAKNISQFFQSVEVAYPELDYHNKVHSMDLGVLVKELRDFYLDKFLHDDPLIWFDIELKQFLKIDVYESPFPYNKGYDIYENDIARVLLIRLEDLNECAPEAMDQFLGIKEFRLVNENVSKDKEYAEIYKVLRENVDLPDSYIEKMYSSKLAKHFYTHSELNKFRIKWKRNTEPNLSASLD